MILPIARLAAALATALAPAPPPFAPSALASSELAFVGVHVVDVVEGALQPDRTVLVRNDRIAWVEAAPDADVPDGATVVDGQGKYLLPGLWDMHVHLKRN